MQRIEGALHSPLAKRAAALFAARASASQPSCEVASSEHWRLEAAMLLIGDGCMPPWPRTFVAVATGGGGNSDPATPSLLDGGRGNPVVTAACAHLAVEHLRMPALTVGADVLCLVSNEVASAESRADVTDSQVVSHVAGADLAMSSSTGAFV